VLKGSSSN